MGRISARRIDDDGGGGGGGEGGRNQSRREGGRETERGRRDVTMRLRTPPISSASDGRHRRIRRHDYIIIKVRQFWEGGWPKIGAPRWKLRPGVVRF